MYTKDRIKYGQHVSSFADIYYPEVMNKNNSILVCLYHGVFFEKVHDLTLMEPLAEDLVNDGYTVANFEYVRVGEGYNDLAMLKNVLLSFTKIVSRVLHEKTVVIGHNAGGYYALMIMMEEQLPSDLRVINAITPDIVIAQAPLTDLLRAQNERLSNEGDAIKKYLDGMPDQDTNLIHYLRISPTMYEVPKDSSLLIVHGSCDEDIPCQHSIDFFSQQSQADKLFIGGGFNHYDMIDPSHRTWKDQKAFIQRSLS